MTPPPAPPQPKGLTRAVEAMLRVIVGGRTWDDPRSRGNLKLAIVRIVISANLLLGTLYITWRYAASVNWDAWFIAIPLLLAETYSFFDSVLFGATMWRARRRTPAPAAARPYTVDVFITCYNEPVDLVRLTVEGANRISYPHSTHVLDDGDSPAMRAMAESLGAGYIVRSQDWKGRARHAKAGNLNNALMQTSGELLLVLDADQVPLPAILDRVVGYFDDDRVAFVQTPQWFYNVPSGDPFGSEAPLFYGPIQEGKDGWNAAFFCGSNAVLRREALFQMGIRRYVWELERRVNRSLKAAGAITERAIKDLAPGGKDSERTRAALLSLRDVISDARKQLRQREPLQTVTWTFQRRAEAIAREMVASDLAAISGELAEIPGVAELGLETGLADLLDDTEAMDTLVRRTTSPLAAIEEVRGLLLAVDIDRVDEAQAVMPMSTISVTEDMATAMRLHSMGWKSAYHDEVLATGLAPEDLRTALQQRLRWAQGTLQVMFRENPWRVRGLSPGQRLMYWGTMASYLSGFAAIVYIAAPILYLTTGIAPVSAYSSEFFWHIIPYLAFNQLLFLIIGWGRSTWRGQQYSLALFPLWLQACWSATANVYFGRKLGFVVTPKTRQAGASLQLIRVQLVAMAALYAAALFGLGRLALGYADDPVAIVVNVGWVCYDLLLLSVVVTAATHRGGAADEQAPLATSEAHGRAGARG
jgi:cellulose synthase (UDP-forming)